MNRVYFYFNTLYHAVNDFLVPILEILFDKSFGNAIL